MTEKVEVPVSQFELNLFPLKSTVMFPESNLPLNIFEDQYKAMVNDCLQNNRLLALAPTEFLGQSQNLTVGFGELKLLGKRKNGTMIVLLQGRGRARIDRILQKEPYIKALVTEIERDTDLSVQGNLGLTRIKFFLNAMLEKKFSNIEGGYLEEIADYQHHLSQSKMVDAAAEFLMPSLEQRQMLLELDDLEGQVAVLDSLLQAGGPSMPGQLVAQS